MVLHEADCHTKPCTSAQHHPNRTQKMIPHNPVMDRRSVSFTHANIKVKKVITLQPLNHKHIHISHFY